MNSTHIQSAPTCTEKGCSCSGGCGDIQALPDSSPILKKGFLPLLPGGILYLLTIFTTRIISLPLPEYLPPALYLLSYFLVGADILKTALISVFKGHPFDEFFLMTLATVGAFAVGAYPEAVAVMLFFKIGELFQDAAVNRSKRSITSLLRLRPDFARVERGGTWQKLHPSDVEVGETIEVRPGERVPLDGEILQGETSADTSALTGESRPASIKAGEEILSGMVSNSGLIRVRVKKPFSKSTISTILELVQNASQRKAETEQFITKFARYYTPSVVLAAAAIAFGPPLLYTVFPTTPFFTGQPAFSEWIYRGLIFLVVSCPCALLISIPLGFFGGIGLASRRGILIKGGNFLEGLQNVHTVVWDKTGTLTQGRFRVTEITPAPGFSREGLLDFAAQAESRSSHPIALSILEARGQTPATEPKEYEEIPGTGVRAIYGEQTILAGNERLMEKFGVKPLRENNLKDEKAQVSTVVHVASNGDYAGKILIRDELRERAGVTVAELKEKDIRQCMLTGDNEKHARSIADELGIDEVHPGLLPPEKVDRLEEIMRGKRKGGLTAYVGDGINDAPVLARADIGIALGGLGSDAAIQAADVVLMQDRPEKLISAMHIAQKTRSVVWQNIALAFGIKLFVLALGAMGMATMWEAVFADVGVALLAVLNSSRLPFFSGKKRAGKESKSPAPA